MRVGGQVDLRELPGDCSDSMQSPGSSWRERVLGGMGRRDRPGGGWVLHGEPGELVTLRQAATLLGVSERYLRRWSPGRRRGGRGRPPLSSR